MGKIKGGFADVDKKYGITHTYADYELTEEEKKKKANNNLGTKGSNFGGFKTFERDQPKPTPKKAGIGKTVATNAGLGLLKGGAQVGALAEDLLMGPYDILAKGEPAFNRSRNFEHTWDTTVAPLKEKLGVQDSTAGEISEGITSLIPSIMVSGGITKATGYAPMFKEAGEKVAERFGGNLLGKGAQKAVETSPEMLNTWLMTEAAKPAEERIPLPLWAAEWVAGDAALGLAGKGIAKGGSTIKSKLGKGATKTVDDPFADAEAVLDFADDAKSDITERLQDVQLPFMPNDSANPLLAQSRRIYNESVKKAQPAPKSIETPRLSRDVDMSKLPDEYPLPPDPLKAIKQVKEMDGKPFVVNDLSETPFTDAQEKLISKTTEDFTAPLESNKAMVNYIFDHFNGSISKNEIRKLSDDDLIDIAQNIAKERKEDLWGTLNKVGEKEGYDLTERYKLETDPEYRAEWERLRDVSGLKNEPIQFKLASSTSKKAISDANKSFEIGAKDTDRITLDESAFEKPDIQLADKVANALSGTSVIPAKMPTFMDKVQGFFLHDGKKIVVNSNMEDPATYVTMHEATHRMQVNFPEQYDKMLNIAINNLKDDHKALIERYQKRGYEITDMPDEYFADLMAEMLHDRSFVGKLRDNAPEVIQPLLQVIDEVIQKVKLALGKDDSVLPFIENLERLRTELAPEYKNYMETFATQQNAGIRKGMMPEGIAAKQGLGKGAIPDTIGTPLKTLKGSKIGRSKYGVGKDIGGQIYVHKNYATDVIPKDIYDQAVSSLPKDYKFNSVVYEPKTGRIRFDEAPDFDTAREPITGKYQWVKPDGTIGNSGHSDQIWHHKWQWVKDDYQGFNVGDSYNWSKQWLQNITNPSGQKNKWEDLLNQHNLPLDKGNIQVNQADNLHQAISSADTSLNQIASTFRSKFFTPGKLNIDIGGGKYNKGTEFLRDEYNTENLVFDPFNRDSSNNSKILERIQSGEKGDTATVNNVLNVIAEPEVRTNVIKQAAKSVKDDGTSYFLIYEGNGTGVGKETTKGWQNNRKAQDYIQEIRQHFGQAERKGNLIIAKEPINTDAPAMWMLDNKKGVSFKMSGSQSSSPLDAIKELSLIGADKLGKTGVNWTKWSQEMLDEYGDRFAEKNLPYIWQRAKELANTGKTEIKYQDSVIPVQRGENVAPLGKGANPSISPVGTKGKTAQPNFGQGSGIMNESQFKTNTLTNSEFLQEPEIQKVVQDTEMLYEVKPNEQSIQRANDMVKNDFWGTVDRISKEGLQGAEDAVASGIITNSMRKEAQATGDYAQLTDWLKTVQPKVTDVAQTLQAISTWKSMTVEGALNMAARVVNTADNAIKDANKFTGKKVELTPDDVKYITEQMSIVEKMPETSAAEIRAKEIEFAKVKKYIADKVPSTLAEKIKGLQRIAMLLNPKTIVSRNTLGNTILGGFETLKDVPGTLVDTAMSKITGQRTTMMPSIEGFKTLGKGAKKGFEQVTEDIKHGVDTSPTRGQYELPSHRIFENPVLNGLDQTTTRALQYGDRPFFQAAYDETLRQQMKIAGVDTPTDAMKEMAMNVAKDRTFQNDSYIAKKVEQLRGGLNVLGTDEFGLGNVIIPFSKTPSNIIDKAVDYSPVGFIRAGIEATKLKKGTFDQKRFVDIVGRSVTGTGLIMLGYDLAKKGVITGNAPKDKDAAAMNRDVGLNPYSFNASAAARLFTDGDPTPQEGDKLRTYDYAQPISVALAIGADLFKAGKDRKETSNIVYEGLKSGGQTILNQSLLQGVTKMLGGYDAMGNILDTIFEFPLQFVPSIAGQVARITDDKARETYDPSLAQTIINKGKTKIPGARNTMYEKVGTLGKVPSSVAGGNSLFNTFFNPGTTQKYNPSPAQEMVLDIYNKTGETIQFPRVVLKTVNGKALTPKQLHDYQLYVGQRTANEFNLLANDGYFRNLDPTEQAKELQKILTDINAEAKEEVLKIEPKGKTKGYPAYAPW